jgi:hypothetical protein
LVVSGDRYMVVWGWTTGDGYGLLPSAGEIGDDMIAVEIIVLGNRLVIECPTVSRIRAYLAWAGGLPSTRSFVYITLCHPFPTKFMTSC